MTTPDLRPELSVLPRNATGRLNVADLLPPPGFTVPDRKDPAVQAMLERAKVRRVLDTPLRVLVVEAGLALADQDNYRRRWVYRHCGDARMGWIKPEWIELVDAPSPAEDRAADQLPAGFDETVRLPPGDAGDDQLGLELFNPPGLARAENDDRDDATDVDPTDPAVPSAPRSGDDFEAFADGGSIDVLLTLVSMPFPGDLAPDGPAADAQNQAGHVADRPAPRELATLDCDADTGFARAETPSSVGCAASEFRAELPTGWPVGTMAVAADGVEDAADELGGEPAVNVTPTAPDPAPPSQHLQGEVLPTSLCIVQIRTDGGTQSRAATNDDTVTDYAELLRSGVRLPPVAVFRDGDGVFWLADGFHRVAAAQRAGLGEVEVDLRRGTRREAVLHSVGANASHGLRRTNADKRRCVELLLSDEDWSKWSNGEIARRCGVSDHFVGVVRRELTPIESESRPRRTANGRTIETTNIGRKVTPATAVTRQDVVEIAPASLGRESEPDGPATEEDIPDDRTVPAADAVASSADATGTDAVEEQSPAQGATPPALGAAPAGHTADAFVLAANDDLEVRAPTLVSDPGIPGPARGAADGSQGDRRRPPPPGLSAAVEAGIAARRALLDALEDVAALDRKEAAKLGEAAIDEIRAWLGQRVSVG